jgi:aconitate hydratase
MSPEYGSTCAIFPIDDDTLRYLRFTGRPEEHVALVEAYAKEQGLWHEPDGDEPVYSEELELDLSTVVPSLAGPARPQDRVPLDRAKARYREALDVFLDRRGGGTAVAVGGQALPNGSHDQASALSFPASDPPADTEGMEPPAAADAPAPGPAPEADDRSSPVPVRLADGRDFEVDHGSVVIAAITSCTNTSNPSVMVAAGLLAARAVERGLAVPPWVKTSLAPGSKVVIDYLDRAGLLPPLEKLGFNLVGFGCTTCIGNSGPLLPEISAAVDEGDLSVVSVLSGNRNFEGRINGDVRMNYLASPPLVVAYALAGTMDRDLYTEPLGTDPQGQPVFLRDIWPSSADIESLVNESVRSDMFRERYADVLTGDERWRALPVPEGDRFVWDPGSTYVRRPPYFDGMEAEPGPLTDVTGARALAVLGDSVTTDHISPAGSIRADSPAGRWLIEQGVVPEDFNSYGARRGNHEVMIRGTFANTRLRNRLAPGTEGGVTVHLPDGEQMTIYEASLRYRDEGVPLVVLAGKEYGSGSSRDWAAKGTALLGVRAVVAESFERIHRSNLVGMGVLPLQLPEGETLESLGITGHEELSVTGLAGIPEGAPLPRELTLRADDRELAVRLRIDTPREAAYFRHGGILPFVLRALRDA